MRDFFKITHARHLAVFGLHWISPLWFMPQPSTHQFCYIQGAGVYLLRVRTLRMLPNWPFPITPSKGAFDRGVHTDAVVIARF